MTSITFEFIGENLPSEHVLAKGFWKFAISADVSYDPGNTCGSPENCYPPEGECNITEVELIWPVDLDDESRVHASRIEEAFRKLLDEDSDLLENVEFALFDVYDDDCPFDDFETGDF